MEEKSKPKQKRKEKRKGQRSGCTLLTALTVVFMFIVLVLLIRGPFTNKPIPATAIVLKLTPQPTASPVYIPPTASATSPPVTVPRNQILYTQNEGQQIYAMALDGSDVHLITKNTAARSISSSSLIKEA